MRLRTCAILLLLFALPAIGEVKVARDGDRVDVTVDGKPFTSFFFGSDSPKPYLHPLRSASGQIVSRSWPMETNVAGESRDHPHHRRPPPCWAEWDHRGPPGPQVCALVQRTFPPVPPGFQSFACFAPFATLLHSF